MSIYKELSYIVKKLKPKRYLEIGVRYGQNLATVDCPYKIGIDPEPDIKVKCPHTIYKDTSDNVFESIEFKTNESLFDLIFVDGMHEFRQGVRDVENSLEFLAPEGMIVCHDVFPFDLLSRCPGLTDKEYSDPNKAWCGDVWKLTFYVRYCMSQLEYGVAPGFPGYLCLWRGSQSRDNEKLPISIDMIDSFLIEFGLENKEAMNIMSVEKIWECRNL